ncbi:MAG TPA: GNAT family N-acetyltransferase [Burkholderiaceae bacterium]|nr:GNAT family N-acetyltransferase [Burkholderiaceae bacterium]
MPDVADLPQLATRRLRLPHVRPAMARQFAEFMARNEAHLRPWDPPRPAGVATAAHWRPQLATAVREFRTGASLRWALFDRAGDERAALLGRINFTQIFRGPFQSCVLGYQLDAGAQGKGLMHEALRAALDDLFTTRGLHRVQAAFVPENERSARLLERLGFERIGIARRYLFINGTWRDHVLTALINPRFDEAQPAG